MFVPILFFQRMKNMRKCNTKDNEETHYNDNVYDASRWTDDYMYNEVHTGSHDDAHNEAHIATQSAMTLHVLCQVYT